MIAERSPAPDQPPPVTPTGEEQERIRKAEAAARWAAEVAEQKTEGRTVRPFRINPHD